MNTPQRNNKFNFSLLTKSYHNGFRKMQQKKKLHNHYIDYFYDILMGLFNPFKLACKTVTNELFIYFSQKSPFVKVRFRTTEIS